MAHGHRHSCRLKQSICAALLGATAALSCGKTHKPDVLLVTVDTLRADHVAPYAPAGSVHTPHLARFAAEATTFDSAVAPMPLTRPSHFSILTSRYPREHGVVNNAIALPEECLTLAEILREQGYATAAFIGVSLLGSDSGAAQGFDHFEHPTLPREESAGSVVERALAWTRSVGEDQPFFLWVHLFDPHLPYAPPDSFRRELKSELRHSLPGIDWTALKQIAGANEADVPEDVFEYAQDLYRGEVEYVDLWFGRLIDGLAEIDRYEKTLSIFTADHGESFEHGVFFEHADSLFDGAIRVPLIVRYPPEFKAGVRISKQVSNLDIAPTVLRAAGIGIPSAFTGVLLQQPLAERLVLIQGPLYQSSAAQGRPAKQNQIRSVAGMATSAVIVDTERVGLVGEKWKLIRSGRREELYRRDGPAPEAEDLAPSQKRRVAKLSVVLDRMLERCPLNVIDESEINPELLQTLQQLGYVE